MFWQADNQVIVIATGSPGGPEVSRPDRIWFNHEGPIISALICFDNGQEGEVVTTWHDDERPDWLTPTGEADRLLFKLVWVNESDNTIAHMSAFTISPYATDKLRHKARQAWTQPVTQLEFVAAVHAFQATHPTTRSMKQAAFATSRPGQD